MNQNIDIKYPKGHKMKNLKNILLGIGLGSLVLGGCENNLKKYTQENKQVYEDCKNFLRERGEIIKFLEGTKFSYSTMEKDKLNSIQQEFSSNYVESKNKLVLRIISDYEKSARRFIDNNSNGLDENDEYGKYILGGENSSAKSLKKYPLKKQLELAKEYTNTLKEIMRNEKYKDY